MSRHIPESFVLFRQRDITIASFGESTRRCWKPTCSTCSLCQCSFVLSLPHLLNSIEHTSCTCSIATVSASCLRTAQSTILNGDPKRSLNSAHRHRTYAKLAICWRRTILCQYLCNRSVFFFFFFCCFDFELPRAQPCWFLFIYEEQKRDWLMMASFVHDVKYTECQTQGRVK